MIEFVRSQGERGRGAKPSGLLSVATADALFAGKVQRKVRNIGVAQLAAARSSLEARGPSCVPQTSQLTRERAYRKQKKPRVRRAGAHPKRPRFIARSPGRRPILLSEPACCPPVPRLWNPHDILRCVSAMLRPERPRWQPLPRAGGALIEALLLTRLLLAHRKSSPCSNPQAYQ
jgi:hypothetical protein